MKAYSIYIVGLQETKIMTPLVQKLPGNYVLRCFPESTRHHGIAFAVSPKLDPHLRRFCSVSDRVAEFQLPTSKQVKPSKLFIIVAYRPHTVPGCAQKAHKHVTTSMIAYKEHGSKRKKANILCS